LRARSSNG